MKTGVKMLMVSMLIGGGLLADIGVAEAQGVNVQVPNATLNNYLNSRLLETFVPENEENPEEDRQYGGVPNYLFTQELPSFETGTSGYDSASLEGIQYLRTKKLTLSGQPYDLTPITGIQELEELNLFILQGMGYGGFGRNGANDLSFMRNRLTELRILNIEQNGSSDGINALLDISELSEHTKLEQVNIKAMGGLQPISMRDGYRKYEVYSPVILSDQFEEAEVVYSSPDSGFTETDGVLKWNAVPKGTDCLYLNWTATQGSFHFEGETQIPIKWK